MKSSVQKKIDQIKKMAANQKDTGATFEPVRETAKPDGLSMAIHSQKDADTFMAELRAITKRDK